MATTATKKAAVKEKKPNPVSVFLNKFFHHIDKGTTMKSEVGAGIGAFFIAACTLIMNTHIIGAQYGNYAGSYLAVTLIAFLGTLLVGLLCNLPLVQTANLGLSTVFISMLAQHDGLTYYNLLLITFISAILYLGIAVSPIRKWIVKILPDPVKKALPVGLGLYVILTALSDAGFVTTFTTDSGITATNVIDKIYNNTSLPAFILVLCFLGVIIFILEKAFNRKKPFFATHGILIAAMWLGGIILFMDAFIGGETATIVVYNRLNLIVATDGANPYNIITGFQSLKLGALFTEGTDFSAFTAAGGNVFLTIVEGVLTFLILGMYSNVAAVHAAACSARTLNEDLTVDGEEKVYIITSALNVAAPILGATPTSIGAESVAMDEDGAKTGLSSVVCAIGLLIACFTWAFPALFGTKVNGVGMWIDFTETKLAAYVTDLFQFADLMLILAGACMLKSISKVDFKDVQDIAPFAAVLILIMATGNFALAVAAGIVLSLIIRLCKKDFANLKIADYCVAGGCLVYLVVALI